MVDLQSLAGVGRKSANVVMLEAFNKPQGIAVDTHAKRISNLIGLSNESDPGVVLVKLSSLIADKCNYNIDKNILETFPLSVTQNGNARQLYDQLGYYMDWYESASVPVLISWIGETTDSSASYTIPKFTAITDAESSHVYSLIGAEGVDGVVVSDTILPADGNVMTVIAMEGTPVQYQFENETVITAQMVDPISRRLYFPHSYVSQNGVFVKNTDQENYASWKRVNKIRLPT